MRLIRFGKKGEEKPGVLLESGERIDCSGHFRDWDHAFFMGDGPARLATVLQREGAGLPRVAEHVRWAAPIARPGKVLCIGLNYADHAKESGMDIPKEPIVFMKAANTTVGPYDQVLIPRNSEKTDWEVELAIVIGRDCVYLESPEAAADYIAGYCVANDLSERAVQLERGGQGVKGKSCDTFLPLGPFLATADEIADLDNLPMTLDVNGQRMQTGSTATMIFKPHFIVHYLSQFMTLEAGDVISTGTPPGVGLGMKPPRYLQAGDVIELAIEGLGAQKQTCAQA